MARALPKRSNLNVQLRDLLRFIFIDGARATASVTKTYNPESGDYITLDDGVSPPVTFYFGAIPNGGTDGVEVEIGADVDASMANLVAAINAVDSLEITAAVNEIAEGSSSSSVDSGYLSSSSSTWELEDETVEVYWTQEGMTLTCDFPGPAINGKTPATSGDGWEVTAFSGGSYDSRMDTLTEGRGSEATSAVSVGTIETDLVTITPGSGVERISVDVASAAGGQALNSFKVYTRAHEDASWVEHALTDTQVVAGYDTDLTTLAAEANAQLVLNARGWQAIKFTATTASSTASVTTRYTAA